MNQEEKPTKREQSKIIKNKQLVLSAFILFFSGVFFYLTDMNLESKLSSHQKFIFKTVNNRVFNVETVENHIKIKELNSKIIFLKVFGWNCEYCQKEIPELIQLKNKFEGAFEIVSIEAQHHKQEEHLAFIKKHHINYHIIDGDRQKKFLDYLKKIYHWDGVIPLTIVLNAKGKVLAFEVGYKSYSLTTLLQTTLKQLTQEAVPVPSKESERSK